MNKIQNKLDELIEKAEGDCKRKYISFDGVLMLDGFWKIKELDELKKLIDFLLEQEYGSTHEEPHFKERPKVTVTKLLQKKT